MRSKVYGNYCMQREACLYALSNISVSLLYIENNVTLNIIKRTQHNVNVIHIPE